MKRRAFITAAACTTLAAAGGVGYLAHARGAAAYAEAVRQTWRHGEPAGGGPQAALRELVRYAALAPSSHNTQCWRFGVGERRVSIVPDYARRCPVVDPDDHHLFVSLGCAAENLLQAAPAMGLRGEHRFAGGTADTLEVVLAPAAAQRSPLFEAIPQRQTTRTEFDARPLAVDELRLLEAAGSGKGVQVLLLTEARAMEAVLGFVVEGNTAQMRDPAFVRELAHWIRFNGGEAARLRDGLFAGASGNPSIPGWLGRLIFDAVFSEQAENDKYARHVRSAAGIAVFVSELDDRAHWIEAGRCFQRFALQATAMGVRTAHLNQPVELASLRAAFAGFLGITRGRPDLVIRFGRGPEMPRSLRRPLESVLL
ncbi:MAG: Tat pathway signal protein [Thauera sp.]|nr:Tat pathway signal protein [Thauera sp.]